MMMSTSPWASWKSCPIDIANAAVARMVEEYPVFFTGTTVKSARHTALPWYTAHQLLEVELESEKGIETAYLLDGQGLTWWLNGVGPVHEVNYREEIQITEETAADYLRFFCYFLRADEGAFAIIESPEQIKAIAHDDDYFKSKGSALDADEAAIWARLQLARQGVAPLSIKAREEQSRRFLMDAAIVYNTLRSAVTFGIETTGEIEMVDDTTVMSMEGLEGPEFPSLMLAAKFEVPEPAFPELDAATDEHAIPQAIEPKDDNEEDLVSLLDRIAVDRDRPSVATLTGSDREVTQAAVATLLEDAIRERDSSLLLQHFNSETSADKPIERLATMVLKSAPVIIIESDIPFVEEFVAGLLSSASPEVSNGRRHAAEAWGDDTVCKVNFEIGGVRLYLISFHAYRKLFDHERAAHELAIKDAAALIGVDRLADVPEPLRRIADLVLKFPRIDRKLFGRIFERVFGVKPSPGWEAADADWTRYLVPADFHAPRRLGLSADQALAFLKDRVANRLRTVSPDSGPGLSDLNGMGEARQIAEDLIADVRAAQAGKIPWSSVDRGFLLTGRPGTGKTTLARAIAKECGIKFIVASAPGWQAAGALDAHLRAMRADFSEARRFAPSILFIDEIDSIGNREKLSGQNAVYQTDVINGLLEQVQGFDISAPVIVIGATNYAENVDPALKRAGRLDQVVQIPLPNIDGLEKIFEYYLKPYRSANEIAADVVPRQLAELAFGLTGADVEFFIRGAARRARRENRQINQQDMLAEVTRRPRRADSAPRLLPDEMRRVAVHEAGHTTSRLLGIRKGADLSFITIVPRLDGSLGFVASLPREGSSSTRRDMMEELETILAGRAAEEIVYGAEDVGLGAGGYSESSDLAVATSVATMLVCQSGLGLNKGLHWTRTPTLVQEKQIEQLLAKSYKGIVERLNANRAVLDQIAQLLVDKQEISGTELRSLMSGDTSEPAVVGNGRTSRSKSMIAETLINPLVPVDPKEEIQTT
ncbi:MAG TPA: AAA family ATPase [Gemmatimonadaceae bacterium]|nr:AAA family ATPase [Gemmatimonadaceae bacterium]